MRTRMALIAATTGAALAAAAGAVAATPGGQYPWAQPDTASPEPANAQPWQWIPTAPETFVVSSSYEWAQPGSWSFATEHAFPPPSVLR